jgi:transposase
MLWCKKCKVWVDRDVTASLNLSTRGRSRFARSLPQSETTEEGRSQRRDSPSTPVEEKGLAGEAMKGNGTKTLILRVDASKLIRRHMPKS